MLVELEIVAGDRDHRGGHRLVDITRRHRRAKAFLGRARAQEHHAQRLLVRRRRTHLGEVERLAQQGFGDRPIEKGVVGAGVVNELAQCRALRGGVCAAMLFASTATVILLVLSDGERVVSVAAIERGAVIKNREASLWTGGRNLLRGDLARSWRSPRARSSAHSSTRRARRAAHRRSASDKRIRKSACPRAARP